MTVAPFPASTRAVCSPIPLVAPVITMTRSRWSGIRLVFQEPVASACDCDMVQAYRRAAIERGQRRVPSLSTAEACDDRPCRHTDSSSK
jgi:hypothetical protein